MNTRSKRKSTKVSNNIRSFLASSGLAEGDMEINRVTNRPNLLSIIYRDPISHDRMTTPDGRVFKRFKVLGSNREGKYRTCKGGGVHLYFPETADGDNVVDYLEAHPNEPIYIVEGEKKAAKGWKEGIPCGGIPGIWCWLANKQDRPNDEKILHPDFDLIPDLERRGVIMVYDSDANNPEKKVEFDKCSAAFEKCLRARGISRYEKIILPDEGSKKIGLDDYLMNHSIADFKKIVYEQSKTVPLHNYIMTSQRFLSANFPPIDFVVQPWLTDCQLTMIHAAPGVGKTNFLLGISTAITRKKLPMDFCGWKIKKGAGVLYVDGEMSAPHMQERLAKLEAAYPNNPTSKKNKLWLLSGAHLSRRTGKAINFSEEYWRDYFFKIVANHRAKIVILDNIVSLMSMKDENDAGEWSVINQWLLSMRAIGKSIIFVHHSSKKGTQRGTSHRSDNLDTILQLKIRIDEGFTVYFEKHRNFSYAEAAPVHIDCQFGKDKVVFTRHESEDIELEERNQEIWEMYKKGKSNKEIAEKYGLSKGRISQIIKEMEEDDE